MFDKVVLKGRRRLRCPPARGLSDETVKALSHDRLSTCYRGVQLLDRPDLLGGLACEKAVFYPERSARTGKPDWTRAPRANLFYLRRPPPQTRFAESGNVVIHLEFGRLEFDPKPIDHDVA